MEIAGRRGSARCRAGDFMVQIYHRSGLGVENTLVVYPIHPAHRIQSLVVKVFPSEQNFAILSRRKTVVTGL
jgi:hypothetical protein